MTMLERLARALCVADGKMPDAGPPFDIEAQRAMAIPDFDLQWKAYVERARSVLRELQNPSDAMAKAGAAAAYDLVVDAYEEDARRIFAAMIDAALVGEA